MGGIKRALEIYRRVDETTKNYPWSVQTTEERWHPHAEGILMVALTTLNLPIEAWKSARLLRAVPNCRLVLMLAYHMLSPALSVEETGLMAYLQASPEAGPSIMQVTSALQNWKCAGRRLVEIGGRLPTATQLLHQSFITILSKHLAANKKVNFVFQQQSSTIPMMNQAQRRLWSSSRLWKYHYFSMLQLQDISQEWLRHRSSQNQRRQIKYKWPLTSPSRDKLRSMQPHLPHPDRSQRHNQKGTPRVAPPR